MKNKLILISLGLITVLIIWNVLFNLQASSYIPTDMRSFDKNGFVDAKELSDEHRLVAENDDFKLYINETTSHFQIENKHSGVIWYSNPIIEDPWKSDPNEFITRTAEEKQSSTLLITYFDDIGSISTFDNYRLSISHPEGILLEEGHRTFYIKYIEDGFQVLYHMENADIDYSYFPKYVTEEELAAFHPDDRFILESIAYKKFDEDLNVWYNAEYETMSRRTGKYLYDYFYGEDGTGYSQEQAIARNLEYGYETVVEKRVNFEVAVEVKLTETGVSTSIITDSIVEPNNGSIGSISLFPFFGTAGTLFHYTEEVEGEEVMVFEPSEGYIVLPDGSGAVMNFNNGKEYQKPYAKRLYGQDYALLSKSLPEDQEQIALPVYGMVRSNNQSAFAAIITQGDGMATINADVSGRVDSYNKVYTSFKLREVESISIGTGQQAFGIDLWTEDIVQTDFTVEYVLLEGEEASYVGIAKVYRDYLIEHYGFSQSDSTSSTVLTAEIIGAYDQTNFFLGVPYDAVESLTTFDEAQVILKELLERDIDSINVLYQGIMNGGINSSLNDRFDLEKVLGGKKDYKELLDYANQVNIDIYPVTSVMVTGDYNKSFDRFRYTASRIDKSQSLFYIYDLPTMLPSSETPNPLYDDSYVVNPYYYEAILNRFLEDYPYENIAFPHLGGAISGTYNDEILYRQDALRIQNDLLSQLQESILMVNPIGGNVAYASCITDLPTESTLYAILDYQIPFTQLVYSGMIDYSTSSLNLDTNRSHEYNILKVIETGSNLKYTLSFDDSSELKSTQFNYYYATLYTNWLSQIEEDVNLLDALGIHEGYLIHHEQVQSNVFFVEYSHGLKIVLNYNLVPITYNGQTVAPIDFSVLEVD